jgi:hypothetical protein
MKLLMSLLILCSTSAKAQEQDKQLHFLASYSLNSTLLLSMRKHTPYRHLKAITATLAVGLAKEATDFTGFSKQDMGANALGVLASSICTFVVEF